MAEDPPFTTGDAIEVPEVVYLDVFLQSLGNFYTEIFSDDALYRVLNRATVLGISGNSHQLREPTDLEPDTRKHVGNSNQPVKRKSGAASQESSIECQTTAFHSHLNV